MDRSTAIGGLGAAAGTSDILRRDSDLPELAPRAERGRHPSRAASIGMTERQIVSMEVHE
jgi:hypothetical protein